ncbi:transposase [Agaribacillus aureus]|uniref:transposase n=1 Tax=Agaribacillus aureus TaxID=3051825 RepID=UPI003D25EBB0
MKFGVFNNTRADCENRIKVLKNNFGLENFCLRDFWAIEASLHLIMVAYNPMNLFGCSTIHNHHPAMLKKINFYCFASGAWIVNHANRRVLKIALSTRRVPWMEGIIFQIRNLSPPFSYSNESCGFN